MLYPKSYKVCNLVILPGWPQELVHEFTTLTRWILSNFVLSKIVTVTRMGQGMAQWRVTIMAFVTAKNVWEETSVAIAKMVHLTLQIVMNMVVPSASVVASPQSVQVVQTT